MSNGELLQIDLIELQFPFELKKQISCSLQLSNKSHNYVAFKVKTTNPKKYCVRPNTGVVLPRSSCHVTVTMQAQKEAPADMQCKDKFLLQSVVATHGATAKDITPEMAKGLILKLTEEKNSAIQQNNKLQQELFSVQSPWEPAPVTYVPADGIEDKFLEGPTNIFESMSSSKPAESSLTEAEGLTDVKNQPPLQLQYLRWHVWILGPAILLATGMVPTLWLPVSSVFIGPNIASLLSLTGLDCIYNLGANIFLLLADSCARSPDLTEDCSSKPPFSYQLWNMMANIMGLVIPLTVLFGSQNSFLQPHLPFISYAVLLGPYLLLLSIQILTEMLTWHWKSPVWLVTPVVYETYRVLQLMRGLKLSAELSAPSWMLHTIRGLVCWWVLILGMQLMRVAWYAGFTARTHQKQLHALPDSD